MKKTFLTVLIFCFVSVFTTVALAEESADDAVILKQAPISCEQFLKDPLVTDQLKIVFGDTAEFTIRMDSKEQSCDLKVVNEEKNMTYEFSSKVANEDSAKPTETFVFDGKTLTLYLYEKDHPKCENVLVGDYEDKVLMDVGYDFPLMDGKCK